MNEDFEKRPASVSRSPCSCHPGALLRPRADLVAGFLLAQGLAGCNGGSSDPVPEFGPEPLPPVAANIEQGHYRGVSTIGGRTHHAEAVLTLEGEFRLYVGGLIEGGRISGAGLTGDLLSPEESMQLSGHVAMGGSEASGTGRVVGEACAASGGGRFCGASAFAEVRLEGVHFGATSRLAGEIRTTTDAGEETWELDLWPWSRYFRQPARPQAMGELFTERLAPFAEGDEVIISLDGAGRMFFQGPATGCTGNAVLTPHPDGEFVFGVDLLIENCDAEFAMLNTRFTGLATETQNGRWDSDTWLVVFASTPEGTGSPVALTMYAEAVDPNPWDY